MSRGSVIYGVLRHATEKEMLVAGVRADLAHIDKPREAVELGGFWGTTWRSLPTEWRTSKRCST